MMESFGRDALLGLVPLPEKGKRDYLIVSATFGFDDLISNPKIVKLRSLMWEHLRLKGESRPMGQGAMLVFYDRQTKKLLHVCLGRAIGEDDTGHRAWLGLRYSPKDSPLVQVDSWPVAYSVVKEQIPADHLVTGRPVMADGQEFLQQIRELFQITDQLLAGE